MRKTKSEDGAPVQIGFPQCMQLEKRRRHSCRTGALLETEQEAAWDFNFISPVANGGLARGLLTV